MSLTPSSEEENNFSRSLIAFQYDWTEFSYFLSAISHDPFSLKIFILIKREPSSFSRRKVCLRASLRYSNALSESLISWQCLLKSTNKSIILFISLLSFVFFYFCEFCFQAFLFFIYRLNLAE